MTAQPLRVAIAGLGTVGCGVVDIISQHASMLQRRCGRSIELTAVSARDRHKDRGVNIGAIDWEDDPLALTRRADVDVIVELIGGANNIARDLVERALKNGKHVVTANKALVASHGAELARIADDAGCRLLFEAAVAGGTPAIKLLQDGLPGNDISRVAGILNGTCNYILTVMQQTGRHFEDVLLEAQALGYAEADPGFDIDGVDAAHKLCILSALAFGTTPAMEQIHCEGIRPISAADMQAADELGYTIRLIGVTERRPNGISLRVHPALLARQTPLAAVDGVYNAVHFRGDYVGDVFIEGPGAGRGPTASSVVADIMDVARGNHGLPFMIPAAELSEPDILPMTSHEGAYYLRLNVRDHPGVLASVTSIFHQFNISVARLIQYESRGADDASIILITHHTREHCMNQALEQISSLETMLSQPCLIRMESF